VTEITKEIAELRELYFEEGIRDLPKVLELVDKNRLSPSYGCFDRSYWHYRTSDFPSGMYQECVLPLALAYTLKHSKNRFFQEERVKELAWAGIDFARRSSHSDGSADDYFPFERAAGATAFSLYACTEAALVLKFNDLTFSEFFKKRGAYLVRRGFLESGTLSNHKALIVLALYNVYLLTKDPFFKESAERGLAELLLLQTEEGWFPEYEGADPGYLTFTIDFLAKYYAKSKDEKVVRPLQRAIEFSSYFMHPDGSYGGEYGSRNTFHFLPHGFELMSEKSNLATLLANRFLEGLERGKRSHLDDDRIFCHYTYNFLQAYLDFSPRRENEENRVVFRKFFPQAGLFVKRAGESYAVISTSKGGVAKIFKEGELRYSDSGFVGRTSDGRTFISQVRGEFQTNVEEGKVTVEGSCSEHRDFVFSPSLFLVFRAFLLLLGRFLSENTVRRLLQRKAILKSKKTFPLRFKKEFLLKESPEVCCTLYLEDPSVTLKELWIASDSTFIYVATSQPYQPGNLKPWISLASILPTLNKERTATFRHVVS
jgi:hypothetical protein